MVQTDLTSLQLSLEQVTSKQAMMQTDLTSLQLSLLMNTNSLILQLRNIIEKLTLCKQSFEEDDAKTKYFTGINSYKMLILNHETIAPHLSNKHDASSLCSFQQLIITLMKKH